MPPARICESGILFLRRRRWRHKGFSIDEDRLNQTRPEQKLVSFVIITKIKFLFGFCFVLWYFYHYRILSKTSWASQLCLGLLLVALSLCFSPLSFYFTHLYLSPLSFYFTHLYLSPLSFYFSHLFLPSISVSLPPLSSQIRNSLL